MTEVDMSEVTINDKDDYIDFIAKYGMIPVPTKEDSGPSSVPRIATYRPDDYEMSEDEKKRSFGLPSNK